MTKGYLESVKAQFNHYKTIGEKTFDQLDDADLFWRYNQESNSIAIIVKHMWGNMMSRWTDFLTTDGEKEWRKRDEEFEADIKTRAEMLNLWNHGWNCLFTSLDAISEEDLDSKTVYIRNEGHSITEAINRQLAHYPYHIGQIVFIGKMVSTDWRALTIQKGNSKVYNNEMFSKPKGLMIIENNKLLIRELTKHDVDVIFEIYSDKEAMKYRGSKPFENIKEATVMINKVAKNIKDGTKYRYAIIEKKSNELVGTFLITPLSISDCKIGCSIGKKHWRMGYGTEVMSLMSEYLKKINFKKTIGLIKKDNIPSIKLVEKLNYKLIEQHQYLEFYQYEKEI